MKNKTGIKLSDLVKLLPDLEEIIILNLNEEPLFIGEIDLLEENSRFHYVYSKLKNKKICEISATRMKTISSLSILSIMINTKKKWNDIELEYLEQLDSYNFFED